VLTPDLSELGLASCTYVHGLANSVDPPLQGTNGHMLYFRRCVLQFSSLTVTKDRRPGLAGLLGECLYQVCVLNIERIFLGGPISGALLSSHYKWLIPTLFSGVSTHCIWSCAWASPMLIFVSAQIKFISFVGSLIFMAMRLIIYRQGRTKEVK
jgi:hypothetical protein